MADCSDNSCYAPPFTMKVFDTLLLTLLYSDQPVLHFFLKVFHCVILYAVRLKPKVEEESVGMISIKTFLIIFY